MNLILLSEKKPHYQWPATDPRVQHIRSVLRLGVGGRFFVGVENGPRGLAEILGVDGGELRFRVDWESETAEPYPIRMILGLPRPQTARRVLQEMTTMGVAAIDFFIPEKGEPSYRQSKLWTEGEWRQYCHLGAEQACSTSIPDVKIHHSLSDCLETLSGKVNAALALDIYEAEGPFSIWRPSAGTDSVLLALGAERGWSAVERDLLRNHGFKLYHLGGRVLKMDTACMAAVALVLSQANWFRGSATLDVLQEER